MSLADEPIDVDAADRVSIMTIFSARGTFFGQWALDGVMRSLELPQ